MASAQQSSRGTSAKRRRVTPSSTPLKCTVFISHADEDKSTIAIPLREKLLELGITAFVDAADMAAGTPAVNAMISAMESADVAVVVLSPEFVARKRSMKELMCFLRRREEASEESECRPIILPFFYRLGIDELYGEPRFERLDSDGKSLYRKSRFFERRDEGQPEAQIEGIKAALQKVHEIMGVRNDVDASNNSTFLMYRRRQILLQELCDKIQQSVQTETMAETTNLIEEAGGQDVFHAYFDRKADSSDLVFDFGLRDDDANACSQEAKLLEMVLEESQTVNRVIAIQGIGGVGKTSVLSGVSRLDRVKERFTDGVYHVSLGMDGTKRDLLEELCKAVERSGGRKLAEDMRRKNEIGKVIDSFRCWFSKKKCLFMVDDVWQSSEISSSIIYELLRLHMSGERSKVLLTTRSTDIASRASTVFRLEPRSIFANESRRILIRYAGMEPDTDEDEKAEKDILERCSGLPLFLAVAGKAVKVLSLRRGHEGCAALHIYGGKLKDDMQSMLRTDVDKYERLEARLMISLDLLEERKKDLWFQVSRSMGELYRRLSVLRKQSKVPMRMLRFLWELKDENEAAYVAREFEQMGLADVEFERRGSKRVEVLRMHDSVYELSVSETRKYGEEQVGHEAILRGYGSGLAVREGCKEWWRTIVEEDGYVHGNVCRHLLMAGRAAELVELLMSPQWTERQLKVNGIVALEADFSLGMIAVEDRTTEKSADERPETKQALQMISEAAVLSWSYAVRNVKELWFQLHGRLKRLGGRFRGIERYVCWIETNGMRPMLACANSFLGEPGGPNIRMVSPFLHVKAQCMATMQDRERVACGYWDGSIAILNTLLNKEERVWKAHDNIVTSIAIGRDCTRLVSGSTDGTAKVWDVESGVYVTTFRGHTAIVNGVVVMDDDKRVVSVSEDGTAQVWNMDTGIVVSPPFTGHGESITCVAVLGDGKHVVTGGSDKMLRLWCVTTRCQVGVAFEGHDDCVTCVAVFPDRQRIVSGSEDGTMRFWCVKSHVQISDSFKSHTDSVDSVAVSGDGNRIISGSSDKMIRVREMKTGTEVCAPLEGHRTLVSGVSFLARDDNDFIVSCSWDGTVRVWDVRRQKVERVKYRHESDVRCVSFTPDGQVVLSGSDDGTLRVWDATSGRQVGDPLTGHSASVTGVAMISRGRFVSVSEDKTICVWDLQTRKVLQTLQGHQEGVTCIAVTPQGDRFVTGSIDETLQVCNLATVNGSSVVLEGHRAHVRKVFVTDDGLRTVSVDETGGEVIVWELETGTILKRITNVCGVLNMSRREVLSVVEEPTVQDDANLCIPLYHNEIWHGEGKDMQVLATMESAITCWALSPDKKTLCVGLLDGHVGFLTLRT